MAETKIVKTLRFPNSSDDYQINAVKQSIARATKSILTLACEQGVDTEVIWFGGSDGTSVGMPSAYCVCNIKKGNNHRTLIDCYCLTDGRHYINGNTYAYTTDTGTWTGWIEQIGTDKKTSSGNTSSKIFLVGATSQSTSGQTTYSHDTVYIGTDGCLYSDSKKTLTVGATTNDIDGGSETWHFNCGTSTTVLD